MSKVRIYELAKEIGISSGELLALMKSQGEFVRAASSTVERPVANRIRAAYGIPQEPRQNPFAQFTGTRSTEVHPERRDSPEREAGPRGGDHEDPASSTLVWVTDPVPAVRSPELSAELRKLFSEVPEARLHQATLRSLGSEMVSVRRRGQRRGGSSFTVLVRFSGAVESAFGLNREVVFFYSTFREFQVRDYSYAFEECKSGGRPVTPDVVFFHSGDERLREKLADWSRDTSQIAVAVDGDVGRSATAFMENLRDYIASRDLFYVTNPVDGDQFFGRKTLLQSLNEDVRARRVAGIFGLRKSGKTSVLRQLVSDLRREGSCAVLIDLEPLPSPPADPVPSLLILLREKIRLELKAAGKRTKELADCPAHPTLIEIKTALESLLLRIHREDPNFRLAVFLDEIEYLTPADAVDVREGAHPSISQFLGTLRSVAQESANFTFFLSGLTSQIVQEGRLYGRPNPLFSWAKTYYMSPFSREEADQMAVTVGKKMGLTMSDAGLESIFDASGGHAFLYRSLASMAVDRLPREGYHRSVDRRSVTLALEEWQREMSPVLREMVELVGRYYPGESLLLECLRTDPETFPEWAAASPQELGHLLKLGLVAEDDEGFSLNTALEFL